MRTHLWLLTVTGLIAAQPCRGDAVKDELTRIQGTWRLVSMEVNGEKAPEAQVKDVVRKIDGDKYEVTRDGKPAGHGTMTLDPAKSPRRSTRSSALQATISRKRRSA